MRHLAFAALLTASAAAHAKDCLPLADLLRSTHIHGISPSNIAENSVTLATHNGLFTLDLLTGHVAPIGESRDDFMGYSASPSQPHIAFASGHPTGHGNLGNIQSSDGGVTWAQVADGIGGPVDFHHMEVSRANPSVIFGVTHEGSVQRSADAGLTWVQSGKIPGSLIDIATSAGEPNTFFAATEAALFKSIDASQNWDRIRIADRPVATVNMGADGTLRVVQIGQGLLEWPEDADKPSRARLPGGYLLSLAAVSEDPLRLMALSADGALILLDDGDLTWSDVADRAGQD